MRMRFDANWLALVLVLLVACGPPEAGTGGDAKSSDSLSIDWGHREIQGDLPAVLLGDGITPPETTSLQDGGSPPDCDLSVTIPPFNTCGCDETLPQSHCGRMLTDEQIVQVEVSLSCAEGVDIPEIQRVVLNQVLSGGDGKTLLDVKTTPSPDTTTYELQFTVAETFQGKPYFVGKKQSLILEARAYTVPPGAPGSFLETGKNFVVWVDINGPHLDINIPEPGVTGGPYISSLPWEFVAGDEGTGLLEADLVLDWLVIDKVTSVESPFTNETYSGSSPFTVLANTSAQFRVVARDCLGNWTTSQRLVKLVAAPPSTEILTVPCPKDGGESNGLTVEEGDADKSKVDLLVATQNSILVGWGSGSGAPFDPLVDIGTDIEGRFIDAHFINVDGDGHPDIVAIRRAPGPLSQGWVTVFRQESEAGEGLRTFIQVEEWQIGMGAFAMEVCDLDGDGRGDVVVAHPGESDSVGLLFSTDKSAAPEAPGPFLQEPIFLTGTSGSTDMKCADVSGNSLPDILLARGLSEMVALSVFLNLGAGNFAMALNSLLQNENALLIDVGHFNDDNLPDIAVYIDSIKVALPLDGLGTGYFSTAVFDEEIVDWENFGQSFVSDIIGNEVGSSSGQPGGEIVVVGQGTNSLVAADLDGDGIEDMALTDDAGDQIQIYYGMTNGEFKEGNFAAVADNPNSLVASDFNNSGLEDLAFLYKDTCAVGLLLSKSEETLQLPCSGKGQCMGSGDGSCDCNCVCVCSDSGLCGWKCGWQPNIDNCGAPPGCPNKDSPQCSCEQSCKCECSKFGELSCPWKVKFKYSGDGSCEEYPGCAGDPHPDCVCQDKCICGCTQAGVDSCSSVSKYVNWSNDFQCEGEGQCATAGVCEEDPFCSGSIPDGGQCVCTCGCQCNCGCKCYCNGSGEPYCYWDCKQDCDWDCHIVKPVPYTPWSVSREMPLPVKPVFTDGRLRPERVAVGDLDLDGIPDIVVATELVSKRHCDVYHEPGKKDVRPVIAFLGNGQTLTDVYSSASFASPGLKSTLIGMEVGNMDGDSHPDLILAIDSWAISEQGSAINFDLLKGASTIYESTNEDTCFQKKASPGTFSSLGGYVFEGRIGAMVTGPLGGTSSTDIILAADGKGSQGISDKSLNRVGVLVTRDDDDWSDIAKFATAYFGMCIPGNAVENGNDGSGANCWWEAVGDCWSYCEPDDMVEAPLVGVSPSSAVMADVDNDGVVDVVVVYKESGDISLFRGSYDNGDYNLSSPDKPPQQLSLGVNPTDIALGDVDGDGWLDLVATVDEEMAIAWGIDGSNFQVPQIFKKTIDGSQLKGIDVETGDVNNDGRDDVVLLSRLNDAIYVFTSDGDKKLYGPAAYSTGGSPVDVAVHDMNLDGCADFIVAIKDTRSVSVILSKDCL